MTTSIAHSPTQATRSHDAGRRLLLWIIAALVAAVLVGLLGVGAMAYRSQEHAVSKLRGERIALVHRLSHKTAQVTQTEAALKRVRLNLAGTQTKAAKLGTKLAKAKSAAEEQYGNGYVRGANDSYNVAYNQGNNQGWNQGYNQGWNDGYNQGWTDGYEAP